MSLLKLLQQYWLECIASWLFCVFVLATIGILFSGDYFIIGGLLLVIGTIFAVIYNIVMDAR